MVFVPVYILILGLTIVIDYFAGIYIEKSSNSKQRKLLLTASLVANIGILCVFKYYNFINENISNVLGIWHIHNPAPFLQILLPIGLSFHTFQAMSYTIEVYRGHQQAERNFGIYSLYVLFYPQLVAGPIERPKRMLPQLHAHHRFDSADVSYGLKLMIWGLFKKAVIADRLSIASSALFDNYQHYHGIALLVGISFFTVQIYCDFSGYSDIAIGAARVMGYRLTLNFNRPFFALSITDFWNRWHISLSNWFRDYLYIPLGGNKVSLIRQCINASLVFTLVGLWHGANWTYVVMGIVNSTYIVSELLIRRKVTKGKALLAFLPDKLTKPVYMCYTFGLFTFSLIFFRSLTISNAWQYLANIYHGLSQQLKYLFTHPEWGFSHITGLSQLGLSIYYWAACLFLVGVLYAVEAWQQEDDLILKLNQKHAFVRYSIYYLVVLGILFFGVFENRQFIYFQF